MEKMSNEYWSNRFARDFVMSPGQHALITGYTGSGKTTTLYWLVDALRKLKPTETIVWFDTMKSSEALTLLAMGPIRFLIPRGCKLTITLNPEGEFKLHEHEIVEMQDPTNPWRDARKGWINVVCLAAYIIDPGVYALVCADTFTRLIRDAHLGNIQTPMSVIIDEFHMVAPASGHQLNADHQRASLILQMNVERLRSLGIRIIGAAQHTTKVRKGVRTSFNWLIIKRGTSYPHNDEPKLYEYNKKWAALDNTQMVIVFPNRVFSDILSTQFYPLGTSIGHMQYTGELADVR